MNKVRYFILALVCCMLVSAPVKAMAAEGKISYLEEIQSVSTGDAQPYALMTLNEDYSVVPLANVDLPSVTKTVRYNPSYSTTSDVLSIELFEISPEDTGCNTITLNLPITITGDTYFDNLVNYELWLLHGGKKYILGSGSWHEVMLDEPLLWHRNMNIGIDLYFSFLNDKDITTDIVIDGLLSDGSESGTYYDSSGKYYGDFSADIDLMIPERYIDYIIDNRAGYHDIVVSMTGGWYMTGYTEREEIGLIKQFKQAMQDQIYSLNVNVTNGLNYVRDIIVTKVDEFIGVINTKFSELFTKMEDLVSTDSSVISGAMDDYQSAEQEVFNPAMDSLTDFDFGSNDISSLGTGFIGAITFVSSCLSNMYDLTPFSAVFDVIATLALASICIGMSRLWFGKKGR